VGSEKLFVIQRWVFTSHWQISDYV